VVTLLFSDVEGSTRLVQRLGEAGYAKSLAAHRGLVRAAVHAHSGREVDCRADEFFVVFPDARSAVGATIMAQQSLAAHPWPDGAAFRVRMGLNTGDPIDGEDGFVGLDVNRAARICAAGHGGQVLASRAVLDQAGASLDLIDLGDYLLAGLPTPERLFQIVIPGGRRVFPALRASPAKNATTHRRSLRRRGDPTAFADAAWRARGLLPNVAEDARRALADLASSLFTAERAADRAQKFLDRVDQTRLDSLLASETEMTPFSKHAREEVVRIEAQIASVKEVNGRLDTVRAFTAEASLKLAGDPSLLTPTELLTNVQRITDATATLDEVVTRAAVLVGPRAYRLKRTRARGVYRSGERYVVLYADTVGSERIRDFETLHEARDFRDAIRLSQMTQYTGPIFNEYTGGGS
jgi:class 3 adenylate cyclase